MSDDQPEADTGETRPKPKRRGLLKWALILALSLVVLGGVGIGGLVHWAQQVHTGPGPLSEETVVLIEPGTGLQAIARQLEAAGVIAHPEVFVAMLRYSGRHTQLKAGEYAFPPGISQTDAAQILIDHDVVTRLLTVPEGLTVAEVYQILSDTPVLTGDLPDPMPPEGSLLPESYQILRGDSRADLIRRMQAAMDEAVDTLWQARTEGLPFDTPEEAVALASIIEKETGVGSERAKVAGVFVNRLRRGMRLQSDPTVIYALTEGQAPLGRPLTRRDWQVDHPYNTYRIDGLPPGPIANPGRDALEAAMNPADTEYLYFVADGTGGHAFARTLREHNRNVVQWRKIRDGAAAAD